MSNKAARGNETSAAGAAARSRGHLRADPPAALLQYIRPIYVSIQHHVRPWCLRGRRATKGHRTIGLIHVTRRLKNRPSSQRPPPPTPTLLSLHTHTYTSTPQPPAVPLTGRFSHLWRSIPAPTSQQTQHFLCARVILQRASMDFTGAHVLISLFFPLTGSSGAYLMPLFR